LSVPQGSSVSGFIAKTCSGSATTFFSDYAYLYAGYLAYFGGHGSDTTVAGAFRLNVDIGASNSNTNYGARLMFL
jgi:hypothetical protein